MFLQFWVEPPYRLRLTGGILGPRLQFLIAAGLLTAIVAQTGIGQLWSFPILFPLILWLVLTLWRRSVWVVVDRGYRRVTVERRRLLGFVTFRRAVRGFDELECVPVTTKQREQNFGGEITWIIHLKFAGTHAVRIGAVVNDPGKVASVLDQIRGFVGAPLGGAASGGAGVVEEPAGILIDLLDADPAVRAGQVVCLLMIALAIYAAPSMAIFYAGLLVFGTVLDWISRRNDR